MSSQWGTGTPKIGSVSEGKMPIIFPAHPIHPFLSYDFNKSLGRGKKGFVNEHSAAVKPFNAAWNRYLSKNLTDDEDEENGAGDEDPLPVWSGKVSINKLDIVFKYNSRGEPLLPSSCLNLKLEEKKHLMRCFIKALYGGIPLHFNLKQHC